MNISWKKLAKLTRQYELWQMVCLNMKKSNYTKDKEEFCAFLYIDLCSSGSSALQW